VRNAIHFTIPFKAVIKKNNRNIGFNRRTGQRFPIKSKRLRQYEQDVCALFSKKLSSIKAPLPFLKGDLKALYLFYFKGKCRSDVDNLGAALQDSAEAVGVYENDRQIKSLSVRVIENTGREDRTQVYFEEEGSDGQSQK
jgi:Holliday junction resolvase RusA-like endonuclease